MNSRKVVSLYLCAAALASACGGSNGSSPTAPAAVELPGGPSAPPSVPVPPPVPDAIFSGAGDIVRCDKPEPEQTAALLDRIPGTVFSLGDNVYPSGTLSQLAKCYTPTWGRHVSRMLTAPGNHDWEVSSGAPYFQYFGEAAGPSGLGYFSTTLGAWHIVSLNSNIPAGVGSAQYEWLKADLAAAPATCTLAMWHHPLFSSGQNGNSPQMRDAWRLLHSARAEIVLSGHDHDYERFLPQDADGHPDPSGLREFVVGTGGASLYERTHPQPNTEVWENHTFGVLKLTLKSTSYEWQFVPTEGGQFVDSGTAPCSGGR